MNRYPHMLLLLKRLLLAAVLLSVSSVARTEDTGFPRQRHILLLHSYGQHVSWTSDLQRGVVDSLDLDPSETVLHVENMDSKIFNSPAYFAAFGRMLAVKYADTAFDLVLTADNNAFSFVRDHRDDLFPGAPVVFGGLNGFRPDLLDGFPGVTGVAEVYSVRETVELALRLHPSTRRLYVINDYLVTGRATAADVDRQLAGLAPGLEIVHAENLPLDGHCEALGGLPAGTLVLLGVFYADRDGYHTTFEEMGAAVAAASPVPVYCLLEFNLGDGAVGGRLVSAYWQGVAMARQARRIMDGADPADLPVVAERANRFMFDHRQFVRWRLSEAGLPPGTEMVNRPVTLWTTYRREVLGLAAVGAVLLLAILVLAENIRRRRASEQALRRSEENLAITLRSIGDAVVVTDRDGLVVSMNPGAAALTARSEEEVRGMVLAEVLPVFDPGTGEPLPSPVTRVLQARTAAVAVERGLLRRADGSERVIEDSGAPILRRDGSVGGVVLVFRDVTDKLEVEERLRQSQKMESIGQLAGGVAHDFNNMLAGIMGYAEMIQSDASTPEEQQDFAGHILTAAGRAGDLTSKLLAFSRKGKVLSTPMDVHAVIEDAVSLLRRSVDRRIELVVCLEAENASVIGDPSEIQQMVLNLCLNARDAMSESGVLTLRTANRWLDEAACDASAFAVVPGDYLEVMVGDTGPGIAAGMEQRIFEPFYTSKPAGEGTGLGLAAVRGAVEEHMGSIEVVNSPGVGAVFHILLPLSGLPTQRIFTEEDLVPMGEGTVLVVDDEAIILGMVGRMLRGLGFKVLTASDGREGLEVFRTHRDEITAVLLDMLMPRMTGRECFREIRRLDPRAQVILASGFTSDHTVSDLLEEGLAAFLKKPYKQRELVRALNRILDQQEGGVSRAPGAG